jgi:hypothetical protein
LAEINNEGAVKNETYATNLAKLEHFVLVKFAKVLFTEKHFQSNIFYKAIVFEGGADLKQLTN